MNKNSAIAFYRSIVAIAAVPTVGVKPIWFRITCDGTKIDVQSATTQAGLDTAPVAFSSTYGGTITGGYLGFHYGCGERIDDVTIRSDPDNNSTYSKIELEEQFNTDPVELRHDAAGNLTFDGNYTYTYDAWNRQIEVKRAFVTKDNVGVKTYHEGSTISTSAYDGQHRRIRKAITNCGNQDYTYVYYYDSWRLIEERNGSDETIKTYVWGNEYIDELIQIHTCIDEPQSFWAMQDAHYNVLGIVNETGHLVERYEYTPYGQRTVDGRQTVLSDTAEVATWANDAMLTYPQLTSARLGSTIPVTLCDFGHQGLKLDQETDQYGNRERMYMPRFGRFSQRDIEGYIDGMNLYQYVQGNPVSYVDPQGTDRWVVDGLHNEIVYPVYDDKCRPVKYRQCGFFAAKWIEGDGWEIAGAGAGALLWQVDAKVVCQDVPKPVGAPTVASSCKADQYLHRLVQAMERDAGKYRLGHNCRIWTSAVKEYGTETDKYEQWAAHDLATAARYEALAQSHDSKGQGAIAAYYRKLSCLN